jgi:hypothetical protein
LEKKGELIFLFLFFKKKIKIKNNVLTSEVSLLPVGAVDAEVLD